MARVRRILGTRAVGHTGTLDPFATGLLVVLVGRATRLARYVESEAKTYLATARLGVSTTTDDATGEPLAPIPGADRIPSLSDVRNVLAAGTGARGQRPPSYSAKHVAGERAYARARRGETVELAEVPIVVHALALVRYEYPELQFRTTVSAGTYVRVLARELARQLGTGAHLTALRREAIGALSVEAAVALEQLAPAALQPPLAVLGHLPRLAVTDAAVRALGDGQAVREGPDAIPTDRPVAAVADGARLVAVGRIQGGAFQPEVVLEAAS